MPTIEEDLRTILFSDAAVGALVGSTTDDARIFVGGKIEEGFPYPIIQIEKISSVRSHALVGGASIFNTDTYQISIWDEIIDDAIALSDLVLTALDGKLATATLPAILAGVETHLYDSSAKVHQIALDFSVMQGC